MSDKWRKQVSVEKKYKIRAIINDRDWIRWKDKEG